MQTPNGILPVDKPAGWTSFDVLAKLRGALGTRKLGHSGTLDPMATGVLAVFIGKATSAADRQLDHDKTYEATLRLGLRTDTGDVTGTTLETAPVTVGEAELRAVLPQFRGDRMQLPPMYSAVKINGQPLYKAARKARPLSARPAPSRSMTSNTSAAPRPTNTPSASPAPRAPTSACWPRRSATPSACPPRCPPCAARSRCVQSDPVPHAAGNFSRRRERGTRNQRLGTADRVSLYAAARPARQQRRQGAPAQRLPDEPLRCRRWPLPHLR